MTETIDRRGCFMSVNANFKLGQTISATTRKLLCVANVLDISTKTMLFCLPPDLRQMVTIFICWSHFDGSCSICQSFSFSSWPTLLTAQISERPKNIDNFANDSPAEVQFAPFDSIEYDKHNGISFVEQSRMVETYGNFSRLWKQQMTVFSLPERYRLSKYIFYIFYIKIYFWPSEEIGNSWQHERRYCLS